MLILSGSPDLSDSYWPDIKTNYPQICIPYVLHASYGNCHKLTDVVFFYSLPAMSSGIIGEFVQFIPLQSPHPTVQSKPCFLHVHTLVLQLVLQSHLIIFSTAWGAIGKCVVCGIR